MPYIGNSHIVGDHINNFKVLDDISSYTATFDGSSTDVVSTTNETIRIVDHRFIQGQRVTYNNGGGSNIGGLSSGTAYYVSFDTANTIKLATSLANANTNNLINLTSAGGGTTHTLTAAFDGTNTKFKLTHNSGESGRFNNATQLQVAINNVLQRPNSDPDNFTEGFAVERGNKIVFQTAPTSNDVFWGSIIANSLPTFDIDATAVDNFTGDGSTTDFTLSRIPPNSASIIVTINGVFQHLSDTTTSRAYSLEASVVKFTSAPANGDEIQVRHTGFRGATSDSVTGFYGRTGNVTLTASDDILTRNINSSGIITAASFSGDGSGLIGVASTDNIVTGTAATFNTYPVDINAGMTVAGVATFAGNVSIAGTLTYEDVTNIDSVGIITAAKDIHVGAGVSAVGVITGRYLNPSSVSTQNLIIGYESSARNVTGSWNVLLGRRAGEGLTSGGSAVCIGANAGQLLGSSTGVFIGGQAGARVTGAGNVFMGLNAGSNTTSATACTIIGTYAGIDNQGNLNTLVGYYAGRGNSGVTDGTRNTFIGAASGFKIEGGDDNTGLGYNSLVELLGGNKNVAIGQQAGDALVSGNNNIIIGYQADASTSTTSNEITLGDANIKHLRVPGIGVSFNNTGGTQLGIITATELDISGDIDVDGHTNLDNVSVSGVTTFSSDLYVAENIIHTGDTDTKIRFTNDVIQLQGGGTNRIQTNNIGARIDTTLLLYGDAGNPGRLRLQEGGALCEILVARNSDSSSFLYFKNEIGGSVDTRVVLDGSGHFRPFVDSTYDLGITGTRWRNVYADTYYGDGSNLTGISADKIFEGNTKAEVIDTGSNGHFLVETEGTERLKVNGDGIDVSGEIELDNGGSAGLNFKRNGTLKADIEIGSANDELAIRARGSSGFILLSTNSINGFRLNSSGHLDLGRDYSSNPSNGLVGITTIRGHRVNEEGDYARLHFKMSSVGGGASASIRAFRDAGSNYSNGLAFYTHNSNSSSGDGSERLRINSTGAIVKQTFTAINTYSATDTTQCGYQSQNLSNTTNTYAALRLTAGNSSPATAQLSSIRTGAGQNDFTIQLESGNTAFEAFRALSNGNFGFGIAAPTTQSGRVVHLHAGANQQRLHMTNNTTGSTATDGFEIIVNEGTETHVRNFEAGNFRISTGGNGAQYEAIRIKSNGSVNIGGDFDQTTYKLKVTGSFAATTKSFVIDHPTKEKLKLRYACLEGPENSVYVRGKTSDSVIELPDYWTGLVHEDSITVNVTPIGNHKVWVESINNNSVTIGSDGSEYFYTVFAERKDVDKLEVEVEE